MMTAASAASRSDALNAGVLPFHPSHRHFHSASRCSSVSLSVIGLNVPPSVVTELHRQMRGQA